MPNGGPSDAVDLSTEIVRRIQSGDESAWDALYRRYRDPLLLSIRCRLGAALRSRLQSEDVLQSVVKDALTDLARFEPRGEGSLGHYLHVCVLNKIRNKADHFGASRRRGGVALTDSVAGHLAAPDATPRYLDEPRFERLERAVARLPDAMREVVLLRQVEGLSNKEAAEVLERSPEATSKLHNRALARLGAVLAPPPDGSPGA